MAVRRSNKPDAMATQRPSYNLLLMIEILLTLLLISFTCVGFHLAGEETYLLAPLARYFNAKEGYNNFLYNVGKAVIGCPRCMGFLYTIIFSPLILQYFILIPKEILIAQYILASIGAVSFINSVLINAFERWLS